MINKSKPKVLIALLKILILASLTLGIDSASIVFAQNSKIRNLSFSIRSEKYMDTYEVQVLDINNQMIVEEQILPVVLKVDDNPAMQGLAFPLNTDTLSAQANTATFNIIFLDPGAKDRMGTTCQTFPDKAKVAFQWAADNIWGRTIVSSVPIEIEACWASIDPSTLGYAGALTAVWGSGLPNPNALYQSSLASSILGIDVAPSSPDMFITYNSAIPWYYGTDGIPQLGKFDLVTVVAHELAHGLQFSGSAWVAGATGSIGQPPYIYDYFMEDVLGRLITDTVYYPNNSSALKTVLTSNNLFWKGSNAKTANNNQRVKMYAPANWITGSSYSHLDYDTFAGTNNSLMVYAVSENHVQHNPGAITACILKDVGWTINGNCAIPTAFNKSSPSSGITNQPLNITLSWQSSTNFNEYEYCYSSVPGPCTKWNSVGTNTSVTLSGLAPNYTYYWQVRAVSAGGIVQGNNGVWWSFTTTAAPSCTFPPHTIPTTASYVDVPMSHWAWNWIERYKSAGLTTGCSWVPGGYCPGDNVTREQMAVFIMRAKRCGNYTPTTVTSAVFTDVPANHWAAGFIRDFRDAKITSGCAWVPGGYCPGDNVTREQMAVFIIRALHGGTYSPPAVTTPVFTDVPANHWAATFIKQFYDEGITTGCTWVPGGFCPGDLVTREQMAVFIGRAFDLP